MSAPQSGPSSAGPGPPTRKEKSGEPRGSSGQAHSRGPEVGARCEMTPVWF